MINFISIRKAAEQTGLSYSHLNRLMKSKGIKPFVMSSKRGPGLRHYILIEDLKKITDGKPTL